MHGVGDGDSWKTCYPEELEQIRKRRSVVTQQSIDEKVKIAIDKTKAETKEELLGAVNAAVTDAVVSLLPALWDFTKNNPNARPEDFPLPSFFWSNSVNTRAPAPAQATAKGPAPVHSSPTSVSCMVGGPSALAELDALTVITPFQQHVYSLLFQLPLGCLTSQTCLLRRPMTPRAPYSMTSRARRCPWER